MQGFRLLVKKSYFRPDSEACESVKIMHVLLADFILG